MENRMTRGEFFGELIGTFFLVLLGDFVVGTAVLTGAYQGQWQPSVLWGLAVAMAVYASGAASGAHLNPAVTLALTVFKGFPKRKVLPFMLTQILGGVLGAAVLFGALAPLMPAAAVRASAQGAETAKIFSAYFNPDLGLTGAFIVEVLLTACLVGFIFAITDSRNSNKMPAGLVPLGVGAIVALLVGIGGPMTMASMNPARDFGPRIFTFIAGWGTNSLPGPNLDVIASSIAPMLGGLVGAFVYQFGLHRFFPAEEESPSRAA